MLGKAQQNVVCIINGMLRKMKTDEQSTPLNEMLICSICLTTDTDGLVILRYLFGFREDMLVDGVIESDALVQSAEGVGAKIDSLMPPI